MRNFCACQDKVSGSTPFHTVPLFIAVALSRYAISLMQKVAARAPFRNYAKPIRGSIPSRAFHRTYSSSHKRYGKVSSTLSSMTTRYPGSSHERYSWRQFCMNTSSWSLKRCSKKSRRLSAKNSSGRLVQKKYKIFCIKSRKFRASLFWDLYPLCAVRCTVQVRAHLGLQAPSLSHAHDRIAFDKCASRCHFKLFVTSSLELACN